MNPGATVILAEPGIYDHQGKQVVGAGHRGFVIENFSNDQQMLMVVFVPVRTPYLLYPRDVKELSVVDRLGELV